MARRGRCLGRPAVLHRWRRAGLAAHDRHHHHATNVTTFWQGAGGTLWSDYYYSGHAWGTPYQVGSYANVAGAPHAVAQANGEMEVFWVDANGAVWVGRFNGTTWLSAVDLGGSVAAGTTIAPAASAPGMVEVFFEGSGDETLWEAGTANYGGEPLRGAVLGDDRLGQRAEPRRHRRHGHRAGAGRVGR